MAVIFMGCSSRKSAKHLHFSNMRAPATSINSDCGCDSVSKISMKLEGFAACTSAVDFLLYDPFQEMNHSSSTAFNEVSVLPRW